MYIFNKLFRTLPRMSEENSFVCVELHAMFFLPFSRSQNRKLFTLTWGLDVRPICAEKVCLGFVYMWFNYKYKYKYIETVQIIFVAILPYTPLCKPCLFQIIKGMVFLTSILFLNNVSKKKRMKKIKPRRL